MVMARDQVMKLLFIDDSMVDDMLLTYCWVLIVTLFQYDDIAW